MFILSRITYIYIYLAYTDIMHNINNFTSILWTSVLVSWYKDVWNLGLDLKLLDLRKSFSDLRLKININIDFSNIDHITY